MAVALPVPEIEADLGGADGQTVDYNEARVVQQHCNIGSLVLPLDQGPRRTDVAVRRDAHRATSFSAHRKLQHLASPDVAAPQQQLRARRQGGLVRPAQALPSGGRRLAVVGVAAMARADVIPRLIRTPRGQQRRRQR